nr:hypothetical protein [Candidatus Enterousia merdequi]
MNKEFKRNILNAIKNNSVHLRYLDESSYTYELLGKNDKVLMTVNCYDGIIPRISIEINGQNIGNLNHFARTEKQHKNNYDISMIANKMFLRYAEQRGYIQTSMNKKQFLLSQFLKKNSLEQQK